MSINLDRQHIPSKLLIVCDGRNTTTLYTVDLLCQKAIDRQSAMTKLPSDASVVEGPCRRGSHDTTTGPSDSNVCPLSSILHVDTDGNGREVS